MRPGFTQYEVILVNFQLWLRISYPDCTSSSLFLKVRFWTKSW